MRKLIVLFSCMLAGIVSAYTQNEKADTETYKETLFVPYHVKNMTILLGKSERDRNRPDVKRWYQYWAKEHAQASMKGKPCPDFVLVDSLGQSRRISDYIGKHKLLFLDFWASWCGPCRRLEPKMKEMLKKYEDRGFGILGISIDRDKNAWLKALREDKRNWPDLCISTAEDEKEIRDKFLITGIPHGVFVDQNGKIVVITSAVALQYVLENYYGEETEFPMDLYKN